MKSTLNILIGLFHRYILVENVKKSNTMTCQPGTLRYGIPEKAVVWRCTGMGVMYRERPRRRIPCQEYRLVLTAVSMAT